MSKETFAIGFAKKAAEHGIDPDGLARLLMEKEGQATPLTDYALSLPGNAIIGTLPGGQVIGPAAYLAGLAGNEDNTHDSVLPALIPGVGSYRAGKRIKTQVLRELRDIEKDKKNNGARPVAHAVAEHLGPTTSILASTLAGAGIGAGLGGRGGAGTGAAVGAGAGALATLIGSIAAAIKRRRTKQEQIDSDKKSVLAKYLIPGTAAYDLYKRVGRSQGEREEDPNNKKKSEKKAEDGQYGLGGVNWGNITNWLSEQKKKYYDNADDATKALIGAGGGALGGALLSKIVGGSGMGGAALGALAGGASSVDWKKISDELGKMQVKKTPSGTAPAAAAK